MGKKKPVSREEFEEFKEWQGDINVDDAAAITELRRALAALTEQVEGPGTSLTTAAVDFLPEKDPEYRCYRVVKANDRPRCEQCADSEWGPGLVDAPVGRPGVASMPCPGCATPASQRASSPPSKELYACRQRIFNQRKEINHLRDQLELKERPPAELRKELDRTRSALDRSIYRGEVAEARVKELEGEITRYLVVLERGDFADTDELERLVGFRAGKEGQA